MRKVMRLAFAVLVALVWANPALARDPLTGLVDSFFTYRAPPPPRGGDCGGIAAEIGPASTWSGEFAGKRELPNDRFTTFSARACFHSEAACLVWQQQALNYAYGPVATMRCRPGLRG
jgi:hypothetical protein